jgi:hypothetical protein
MKNNLLKFYIVAIYLCSTVVLFAEETTPGADAEGGGLEGTAGDNTGTPIGDYIWVLALAVVVYAFWKIRAVQNSRLQD